MFKQNTYYYFQVIAGFLIQQRQHLPFNFKKTSILKLRSQNLVLILRNSFNSVVEWVPARIVQNKKTVFCDSHNQKLKIRKIISFTFTRFFILCKVSLEILLMLVVINHVITINHMSWQFDAFWIGCCNVFFIWRVYHRWFYCFMS